MLRYVFDCPYIFPFPTANSFQVVAGIVGHYLHEWSDCDGCEKGRYIYTEVIAALSLFFGIILLVPFTSSVVAWHRMRILPQSDFVLCLTLRI